MRIPAWKPAPFLDLSGHTTTDGERGLLSIAFPPDYTASGLSLRLRDRPPTGRSRSASSAAPRATPTGPRPGLGSLVLRPRSTRARTTTAASSSSGPTGCSTSASATAARATTPTTTARTSTRCSARSCASTRRAHAAAAPTASRRTTRSRRRRHADPRSGPRAAQPLAFWFDRATGDLWIGDVGQDTREEVDRIARRRRRPNYGWTSARGFPPPTTARRASRPRRSAARPRPRRRGAVDHRRLRLRGPGLPTLAGALPPTATPASRRILLRHLRTATPAARPGWRSSGARAFGEDACGLSLHRLAPSARSPASATAPARPATCPSRRKPAGPGPPAPARRRPSPRRGRGGPHGAAAERAPQRPAAGPRRPRRPADRGGLGARDRPRGPARPGHARRCAPPRAPSRPGSTATFRVSVRARAGSACAAPSPAARAWRGSRSPPATRPATSRSTVRRVRLR